MMFSYKFYILKTVMSWLDSKLFVVAFRDWFRDGFQQRQSFVPKFFAQINRKIEFKGIYNLECHACSDAAFFELEHHFSGIQGYTNLNDNTNVLDFFYKFNFFRF